MAIKEKVKPSKGPVSAKAAAAEAPAKATKEKAKKGGVCLFSGEPTGGGNFRPGYDAKMKSLLLRVKRGEAKLSEVPKAALPFLRREEGLVGFRLDGNGLEVIGKFSAEPRKAKKVAAKAAAKAATKKQKAAVAVDEDEDEDEDVVFDEDED